MPLEIDTTIAMAFLKLNALYPHQSAQPVPLGDDVFQIRVNGKPVDDYPFSTVSLWAWMRGYIAGLENGVPVGVSVTPSDGTAQ